ncbi:MAG TPA: MarR family transcriptional regulator [Trueperaceae bacterium]
MPASERIAATRGCLCLEARRTARLLTRHYDEHLRPTGLRATQFSVLAALANTGGATVTRLADLLGLERTSLSRSAELLEERGWVESASTGDARERRLTLTSAGLAQLERSLPAWEAAQASAPTLLAAAAEEGAAAVPGGAV